MSKRRRTSLSISSPPPPLDMVCLVYLSYLPTHLLTHSLPQTLYSFLADPVGRFNPSSGWANERARWLVSQAPGNHPAADQQGSVSWSQETNCQRGGARKKRFIWAREIKRGRHQRAEGRSRGGPRLLIRLASSKALRSSKGAVPEAAVNRSACTAGKRKGLVWGGRSPGFKGDLLEASRTFAIRRDRWEPVPVARIRGRRGVKWSCCVLWGES